MLKGKLLAVGTVNSVMTPPVVIRPILLPLCSMNQRAPSGPAVMPRGKLPAVGTGNSLGVGPQGSGVGVLVGVLVGVTVGVFVAVNVGVAVGVFVGVSVGVFV